MMFIKCLKEKTLGLIRMYLFLQNTFTPNVSLCYQLYDIHYYYTTFSKII